MNQRRHLLVMLWYYNRHNINRQFLQLGNLSYTFADAQLFLV